MSSEHARVADGTFTVDAHQHFWDLDKFDFSWITPERSAIRNNFLPEDLAPALRKHGISKTILVQAVPDERETDFLLTLANEHAFIAKVVGWVDLEGQGAGDRIRHLRKHPKLVGLRPMLQAIRDANWILRPGLEPAIHAILETSMTFDALVMPRHLPALLKFAERYPALPIVINHCAKPEIEKGNLDQWRNDIYALAQCQNVFCKLSGLTAQAPLDWTMRDLVPVYQTMFDLFGPERVMWGSDWPVLLETAQYSEWFEASSQLLSSIGPDQRADILGRTAQRFYKF